MEYCATHFDGQHFAFLLPPPRAAHNFCYSYELLLEYIGLTVQNAVTVSSYIAVKKVAWGVRGGVSQPTEASFYSSLKIFTSLLGLHEVPYAVCCEKCGAEPEVVLCDGTSATIRFTADRLPTRSPWQFQSGAKLAVQDTARYEILEL